MEPATRATAQEPNYPPLVRVLHARDLVRRRTFQARKVVARQGDDATCAYFIETGCVRTYVSTPHGRRQGLRLVGPGGIVGMDAFGRENHPATIETMALTILSVFSIQDAVRLATDSPDVWRDIVQALVQESEDLRNRLHETGMYGTTRKIATFLVRELDHGNGSMLSGLYQRDIAEFLNMASATVCRVLANLRSRGVLVRTGLHVRDMPTLRRLADSTE